MHFNYLPPKPKTNCVAWNNLPCDLKSFETINCFKNNINVTNPSPAWKHCPDEI